MAEKIVGPVGFAVEETSQQTLSSRADVEQDNRKFSPC